MPNFLTDNQDILFNLEHLPLEEIAGLQEEGFREAGRFDYAPADAADAVDNYKKVLELVGDIAGDSIAPLSESIDRDGRPSTTEK
ncbi:MAG: hypothetical protein GWP05_11420 [Anaerolineaceae bacterium]|nr:hypothetical protein [Anaerolineaceae bacterium]